MYSFCLFGSAPFSRRVFAVSYTHLFVINLQVKIIAGILLMMLFAVPMGQFIDRYIGTLFEDVQKLLLQL